MPLHSPSPSVAGLIRNLASRDRERTQAARARLMILGSRAVEGLIATLEGGNDQLKLQSMPVLALIRDGRAREPLIALLMDRDAKIRETAARALAHFPTRETIVRLERVVKAEPRTEVRVAAIQSLVRILDEGHDEALREVLAVLFDANEPRKLRLAAFALLPCLSPRGRRGVLKRLASDMDSEVAQRAHEFGEAATASAGEDEASAPALAARLASPRCDRWNDALHRLMSLGGDAIPAILSELRRRRRDPEYASRAAMVLKALGPRRLGPIMEQFQAAREPLALELLVDVVGSVGDKPLVYRLNDVISSLAPAPATRNRTAGSDPFARVRGKAHLALARIGSRVAMADLRRTLSDPTRRVEAHLLAALAKVGSRHELADLFAAYRREDGWMRARIREVFWQIVRREKIRRRDSLFEALRREDRRAFDEILVTPRVSLATPLLPGLELPLPRP